MPSYRRNRGTIRQIAPFGGKPMEVNDGGQDDPEVGDGRRILLAVLCLAGAVGVVAFVASLF